MIESLTRKLLGSPIPAPPDLRSEVLPEGVVLRRGRFIPWIGGLLSGMQRPAAAVTLGRTIVVNPESQLTKRLLAHELAHVRQWERDRLFPLRYTMAALRYGYRNNPYEVEAREGEISGARTLTDEDTN